jgi:amidase
MYILRSWLAPLALLLALLARLGAAWAPASPGALAARANGTLPDLYEASIAELQAGLNASAFTSVDLVKAYLMRIDEVNYERAALHAVIETNPSALFEAQVLDEERAFFGPRGPLHGTWGGRGRGA